MTIEERRKQAKDYYREHKKEIMRNNHKYFRKKIKDGGIKGFLGCEDCRTCAKIECRHNRSKAG